MIVAIAGRKHSGKSELARRLQQKHGFRVTSPIDPAKRFGMELGFPERCMFGPSSAREEPHPTLVCADGSPLTGRLFLDTVSRSVRDICPSILLVRSMMMGGDVVNESVRLRIELEAYREAGAKLIRRKGGIRSNNEYDELESVPDSFFDAVLPAFDTLEQLHFAVDTLVSGWRSEASL